ncbi:MAG TPA: thymidine phosphorylase [Egibacteraceae bacterium]|nr:thymidine phosphorylase [Egibacteraceae bacterium]
MRLRAVDLVARKRDGGELSAAELDWLVRGYLDGAVMEGQMAALLMAGVLRGFSDDEAIALTDVLLRSGDRMDLSGVPGPTVDKHSTGGVGDGTTLLVAPLLAAAGCTLVKLSGRGLGHTGGTLDKLEAIPGLRTALDPDEARRIAEEVGCVVAAQSERLVPADKALYALRDVTATVPSVALIASSVMSKKLASGAAHIVLDVKAGDGAFMPDEAAAAALAELCVRIGTAAGRRTVALVSAMDQPLGTGIGNALEVAECVRLLREEPRGRLAELALDLASAALMRVRAGASGSAGGDAGADGARDELRALWRVGQALERLRAMIAAQGGDPAVCDDPGAVLPRAPVVVEAPAPRGGVVEAVPARAVGELSSQLGAGRARKEDAVDPAVGVELRVEIGDRVEAGQPLAVVHARGRDDADMAAARLAEIVRLVDRDVPRPPTLLRTIVGQEEHTR